MRNCLIVSVFVVSVFTAGCSVTIGGGPRHWEGLPQDDQVTMTEIDAAADLMMESSRESTLKNIAARPNLSARSQEHLVSVALNELMMESSRESVILTLIKNPYFVSEGKMAILEHMDAFMMESTRRNVMEALNRRGYVPSGKEVEILVEPARTDQPVQVETTIQMNYSTRL